MRRIPRVSSRNEILPARYWTSQRSSGPCIFCQLQQSFRFSTTTPRPAKDPKNLTFLERTRNRIWGTDKPPGYDDPYTGKNFPRDRQDDAEVVQLGGAEAGESNAEQLKQARRLARREQKLAMMEAIADAPHHEEYTPATTTEGLETVTGDEEVNELGLEFEGYLLPHHLRSELELSCALYRALVEVYAKVSLKLPLRRFKDRPLGLISDALAVKIQPGADGEGAILEFPNKEVRDTVMEAVTPKQRTKITSEVTVPGLDEPEITASEAVAGGAAENTSTGAADTAATEVEDEQPVELGDTSAMSAEDQEILGELDRATDLEVLNEFASSWPQQWKRISLAHPFVKLAVVRRTSQLIGFRIPDTLIAEADTADALLRDLVNMNKKPASLHEDITGGNIEELMDGREEEVVESRVKRSAPLTHLPNVRISGRRETVIDKERRVGRLKVIEEELKKRDLPLLGQRRHEDVRA